MKRESLIVLLLVAWTPFACLAQADADTSVPVEPGFESMASLTPGEQYRRLGLMRLAGQGVTPELLNHLVSETGLEAGAGDSAGAFDPDDYTTPLARIVGQDDMRAGATALFAFASAHDDAMAARMANLAEAHPVLIELVNRRAISEDAILVRTAMADAIADGLPDGQQAGLDAYRSRTLFLRNELEFGDFDAELARLTDAAIAQVGGRTEAWQRMFDDETQTDTFDHHIQAAESVYTKEPIDVKRAGELVDELIEDVIEWEGTGTPDP